MGILFGCSLVATGCSVTTPAGTARIVFDKEETAAANVIKIGDKEINISATNAKDMTDKILDSVTLPSGTDVGELKNFIYGNLEQLGIDLENVDFDADAVADAVNEALESAGVTTETEAAE